jgi:hypothetical protein
MIQGVYFDIFQYGVVMGIKGRRVHMIEELSETIISFQRGKSPTNARFRPGRSCITICIVRAAAWTNIN